MHVFDTGKGPRISYIMATERAMHNRSMVPSSANAAHYLPQHIEVPFRQGSATKVGWLSTHMLRTA